MALKEYYKLLEIAPTASSEEVKRAFRLQIARYHPDKVQHLGQEFQAMAADRAAELTEAYRILSDDGRRAEYDLARGTTGAETAAAGAAPPPARAESAPPPSEPDAGETPPPQSASEAPKGGQFTQERATRDEYVRKATVGRFRQALFPSDLLEARCRFDDEHGGQVGGCTLQRVRRGQNAFRVALFDGGADGRHPHRVVVEKHLHDFEPERPIAAGLPVERGKVERLPPLVAHHDFRGGMAFRCASISSSSLI